MKRHMSVLAVTVAALAAGACGFQSRSSSSIAPTSISASVVTGNSESKSTPSYVGTWASAQAVSLPTPSSCGNFQWQVTSQTATAVSGTFSASCAGSLTISGSASGELKGNQVPITANGTASMPGIASCSFSLTGTGTIVDNDTLTIPYSGTTCLGPVNGSETLRRRSEAAPPPAPEPVPISTPAPALPPPSISAPGGFDLGSVTILGSPDVRGWPVTSRISSLAFAPGIIHIDHTKRGQWPPVVINPDGTTQEATIWVFLNINGRWYGTGGERLRPFQTEKEFDGPSRIGPGWLYDPHRWGPMAGYEPRPGELVGFMVVAGSTRSDDQAPVRERTGVVLVNVPADGVRASFPPFAWEE